MKIYNQESYRRIKSKNILISVYVLRQNRQGKHFTTVEKTYMGETSCECRGYALKN